MSQAAAPPRLQLPDTAIVFGRCEMWPAARRLWLDGQPQTLPPAAFDLLLWLWQERHRSVGRDELVQALWPGRPVSDMLLALTLLQARQAIGDTDDTPRWLHHEPGTGYRFVEPPTPGLPESDVTPVAAAQPVRPLRLGLLPVQDAETGAGDPMPRWAALGLPALVAAALSELPGLSLVTAEVLQGCLPKPPPGDPPDEPARRALQGAGLDQVLRLQWRRQAGVTTLGGALIAVDGTVQAAEWQGADTAVLAGEVAAALPGWLWPGAAPAVRGLSQDPVVLQAFARGVECFGQGLWHAALLAFELVLQAEPEAPAPRLWRLRCAVEQGLPEALSQGLALKAFFESAPDTRLRAETAALLQRASSAAPSEAERAAACHHGREAMTMAHSRRLEPWALQLRTEVALRAAGGDDVDEAFACLEAVEADAQRAGAPWLLGLALQAHGQAALGHGRLEIAGERLAQALHLQRGAVAMATQARTAALLAAVRAEQGRLAEAETLTGEAIGMIEGLPPAARPAELLSLLALAQADSGASGALARLLAAYGAGDAGEPVARAHRFAARACEALAAGDGEASRRLLSVAAACLGAAAPQVAIGPCLVLLSRLGLVAGDSLAAADLMPAEGRWLGMAAGPLSRGQLLHVQATSAWAAGEPARALRLLESCAQMAPASRQQIAARLDPAWLQLDAGRVDAAEALLQGTGEGRVSHPAGLAVAARCRHARGHAAEAAELQAQAIRRHAGPPPAVHRALLQAYTGGAARVSLLPPLPVLVSDSWLPGTAAPRVA